MTLLLSLVWPLVGRLVPWLVKLPRIGSLGLLSVVAVGVVWFGISTLMTLKAPPDKVSIHAVEARQLAVENSALRRAQEQYLETLREREADIEKRDNAIRLMQDEFAKLREETSVRTDAALPWSDRWLRRHTGAQASRNN